LTAHPKLLGTLVGVGALLTFSFLTFGRSTEFEQMPATRGVVSWITLGILGLGPLLASYVLPAQRVWAVGRYALRVTGSGLLILDFLWIIGWVISAE
jgi:hypothetical protein